MELNDAVALVTGGSEGIGRAIAEVLSREGCRVTITGRREGAVRATAEELGLDWIVADVGSESDAVRTVSAVIEKHGRLDILVNNAGYGIFKPLVETTLEEMESVYRTNVFGTFLMAREAARPGKWRDDQHRVDLEPERERRTHRIRLVQVRGPGHDRMLARRAAATQRARHAREPERGDDRLRREGGCSARRV